MLRCSKDALLAAALCAFTVTAWAGPIAIPVPGASTAASPAPAYGSPGASTAAAPAAASAAASPPAAAAPPANTPPKPGVPDYSHLDASALLVQPFGDDDVGHGEKLSVSRALSEGAFLILDGARYDSGGTVRHSFDLGVGINTDGSTGRSFYATVTWTGDGFQPSSGDGVHGHGYAVAGGIRVLVLPSLELDTEARYDSNRALDGHLSGQLGLLYEFHPRLWIGLTLGTSALENDYLLTLRWTFR